MLSENWYSFYLIHYIIEVLTEIGYSNIHYGLVAQAQEGTLYVCTLQSWTHMGC